MKIVKLSKFRRIEQIWFDSLRKYLNLVHITKRVNITGIVNYHEKYFKDNNKKISYMAFFIKAFDYAYKKNQNLLLHQFFFPKRYFTKPDQINISFTAEKKLYGEQVVFTPIIRDIESKTIFQINDEIRKVADSAPEEIEDFKFLIKLSKLPYIIKYLVIKILLHIPKYRMRETAPMLISNLGNEGIDLFQPWHPQCMGYGRIDKVANNGKESYFININYCFDHVLCDGKPAGRFLKDYCDYLENFDSQL